MLRRTNRAGGSCAGLGMLLRGCRGVLSGCQRHHFYSASILKGALNDSVDIAKAARVYQADDGQLQDRHNHLLKYFAAFSHKLIQEGLAVGDYCSRGQAQLLTFC